MHGAASRTSVSWGCDVPISKHYGGHGAKIAAAMKEQYGNRWKEVFYATENARKKHRYDQMVKKGAKKK